MAGGAAYNRRRGGSFFAAANIGAFKGGGFYDVGAAGNNPDGGGCVCNIPCGGGIDREGKMNAFSAFAAALCAACVLIGALHLITPDGAMSKPVKYALSVVFVDIGYGGGSNTA